MEVVKMVRRHLERAGHFDIFRFETDPGCVLYSTLFVHYIKICKERRQLEKID